MQVEIWSDVLCPWCYIGKRRFEAGLARFAHVDEVQVTWRSFELDPSAPRRREGPLDAHLAAKYGVGLAGARALQDRMTATAAEEGLAYDFARARAGSSFDAHRLLHLAAERGCQDAMKERLLAAYLCEGEAIGEPETLTRLAAAVGLEAEEARAVLASDRYAEAVRADEEAAGELGISGVPFFVIDRAFGVSGAQSPEVIVQVLDRAWSERHPLTVVGATTGADPSCADGCCAV